MEDYKLRYLRASHTLGWPQFALLNRPEIQERCVEFKCFLFFSFSFPHFALFYSLVICACVGACACAVYEKNESSAASSTMRLLLCLPSLGSKNTQILLLFVLTISHYRRMASDKVE